MHRDEIMFGEEGKPISEKRHSDDYDDFEDEDLNDERDFNDSEDDIDSDN